MSPFDTAVSRRSVLLGAAGFGAALALAGCGGRGSNDSATVRFLNPETDPAPAAVIDAARAEYKAQTGIDVMTVSAPQDTFQQVINGIKSGRSYDLAGSTLEAASYLGDNEFLFDMQPLVDQVGGPDAFMPQTLTPLAGKYLYFPYDAVVTVQYYRSDWLNDVGEQVPTTWDEFRTVARKLTNGERYGWAMPMAFGSIVNTEGTDLLWSNRVEFFDQDWNVILDDGPMLERTTQCLEFLLSCKEFIPPNMVGIDYPGLVNTFVNGVTGITPYAGRVVQVVEDTAPDLADKMVIAGFPSPDGTQDQAVTLGADNFIVPQHADNAQEAFKFLEWFIENYYVDFVLTAPTHYQPSLKSVYDDPRWKENHMVTKYKAITDIQHQMLSGDGYYASGVNLTTPGPGKPKELIVNNNIVAEMYQDVMIKGDTPVNAAKAAADRIRKLMADE